jgi:DNA-binding transcriptional regulator YiaG
MDRRGNLAIFLKKRREMVGLSQGAVAQSLGYSCTQMVSNWERGKCNPPLSSLRTLMILYQIKPKEFVRRLMEDFETNLRAKLR